MRLRDVDETDVDAYIRMRCDTSMGRGLERAALDGRLGVVHPFPAVTNAASNRLCAATGFTFVAVEDLRYAGQVLRVNHWQVDPTG